MVLSDVLILGGLVMIMTMLICWISVFIGGYLMFKGKSSVPGERFIGGVPKGEVFSLDDEETDLEDTDKTVMERTKDFLNSFERRIIG